MTAYGPRCTEDVRVPVMLHEWRSLTCLHWSYDPPDVQRLLPPGYTVETREDRAWVGLVPFEMRLRFPVPQTFPETNVRTYVTGPDGRTGIWFFSLDAGAVTPVLTARSTYRLPYFWSRMAVASYEGTWRYESARRWPGPTGARCDLTVEVGERYEELTELDHFLTARFALYSPTPVVHTRTPAKHPPWMLWKGTVHSLDQSVLQAAGLPDPQGGPLVHWSPGVSVAIGPPSPAHHPARGG